MKQKILISGILALHGVAVVSLMTLSGCQTGRIRQETPPPPVLPPREAPQPIHTPGIHLPPPPTSPMERLPAPSAETATITVQKGETLSHIAARYGMTWRELADLNAIADPNRVRAGQKLVVPANAAAAPVRPAAPKVTPKPAAGDGEYVVKPGDSIWKIARDQGVKEADLRQANQLEGDRIRVGQKLIIPGAAARAPAPAPAPAAPKPSPLPPPPPAAPIATPAVTPAAPVPPPPPTPTAQALDSNQTFPYTIREGDTLESIAKTYVMFPEEILKYNPDLNPSNLTPGKRILIPLVP